MFKELKSSHRLCLGSKIARKRFSSFVQADGTMNSAMQVEFIRGYYVTFSAANKNLGFTHKQIRHHIGENVELLASTNS